MGCAERSISMSVECDRRAAGNAHRLGWSCVAALLRGLMLSSIVTATGCGPVDPVMQWKVYEAHASETEVIRITVLEMRTTLGRHAYSSPSVELARSDGANVIIRLYDKPDLYEVVKRSSEGKETRVPLSLIFTGLNIKEYSETHNSGSE